MKVGQAVWRSGLEGPGWVVSMCVYRSIEWGKGAREGRKEKRCTLTLREGCGDVLEFLFDEAVVRLIVWAVVWGKRWTVEEVMHDGFYDG